MNIFTGPSMLSLDCGIITGHLGRIHRISYTSTNERDPDDDDDDEVKMMMMMIKRRNLGGIHGISSPAQYLLGVGSSFFFTKVLCLYFFRHMYHTYHCHHHRQHHLHITAIDSIPNGL